MFMLKEIQIVIIFTLFENRERYPIRMRILRDFREIDFLKNMPIRNKFRLCSTKRNL